jgi:cytochrome P450
MTAISTTHDAHRRLRMPLEKLFARHSILRIEPRVISRTEKLCARLESYRGSDRGRGCQFDERFQLIDHGHHLFCHLRGAK